MKLKTVLSIQNGIVSVGLNDYDERQCRDILTERNSYVLKVTRSHGSDRGGSQCSDECDVYYEEIVPERILVKDGHFFGVSVCVEYEDYNGYSKKAVYDDAILPADKTISIETAKARDGFSFANDDHSRWNYRDYELILRSDTP